MKKIFSTTIAAAILSTGLMAADDNTATTALQTAIDSAYSTLAKNDYRAEYSIGVGYANLDGRGKTSLMLDANPVAEKNGPLYWNFNSEIGDNHFEIGEKVFANAYGVIDPFFGFGYSRTKIETTPRGSLSPEDPTTSSIHEGGGFMSAGIGGHMEFDMAANATFEAGYRFGAVDGWMANVAVSNVFGPSFDAQKIGFKCGYEQFRTDAGNYNRKTIYLTYSF